VAKPVLNPGVLHLGLNTVQQGLGQGVHEHQARNILQENWKKMLFSFMKIEKMLFSFMKIGKFFI
jgi:hypothetical protein